MNRKIRKHLVIGGLVATSYIGWTPPSEAQQPNQRSSRTIQSSQTESVSLDVLMRGPVHEGFAEPAVSAEIDSEMSTRGTLQLPEPVPDPIDERPALARPSDPNREAVWLPGYWGVEDQDHLCWVSGTWRYAPPNMRWVPGYWVDSRSGWNWVPGFWVPDTTDELTYLPPPPAAPRNVVRYREPRNGRFWVPGHYTWQGDRYVWIDGFYANSQANWVWVPQRLVRTPRGYLEIPGFWDYPLDRRGTLFAPVRFNNRVAMRTYRPNVALNVGQALVSWFVRPNYGHYYFGSYYGDRFNNFGLIPWGPYAGRSINYYDPLYTYFSTSRTGYLQDLVRVHQQLIGSGQGNVNLPVTFNEYQRFRQQSVQSPIGNLARTIDEIVRDGKSEGFEELGEFVALNESELTEQFDQQIEQIRRFAEGRRQAEIDSDGRVSLQDGDSRQTGESESSRRDGGDVEAGARAGADVRIGDDARVGTDARAGAEGRTEAEGRIGEDSRIGADAEVESDARIREGREMRSDLRNDLRDRQQQLQDRIQDTEQRLRENANRTVDRLRDSAEDQIENREIGDAADRLRSDVIDRTNEARDALNGDAASRIEQRMRDGIDRSFDQPRDRRVFDMRPYRQQLRNQRSANESGNTQQPAQGSREQIAPPAALRGQPSGRDGADVRSQIQGNAEIPSSFNRSQPDSPATSRPEPQPSVESSVEATIETNREDGDE